MFSAIPLLSCVLTSYLSLQVLETQEQDHDMPISQVGASHIMSSGPASLRKESPLLNLPLELRLRIYNFCFPFERLDLTVICWTGPRKATPCHRPVQLLRTCQAIRAEAEPMLRQNTIIVSDAWYLAFNSKPSMLIQHLEIKVDTVDVEGLFNRRLSVPPEVKSLQLINWHCDLSCDWFCYDGCWKSVRRMAATLFAESSNFNVLEDFSDGREEVVFGMRYEQELSRLNNYGEVIMVKPDTGRYPAQ